MENCDVSPVVGNARGRGWVFVNGDNTMEDLAAVCKDGVLVVEDTGGDEGEYFTDAVIRTVVVKGECELV